MRNSQLVLALLFDGAPHSGEELLTMLARNTNPADSVRAHLLAHEPEGSLEDQVESGNIRMLRAILNRFLRYRWVDVEDYDSPDPAEWFVGLTPYGVEGVRNNAKVRRGVFLAIAELWAGRAVDIRWHVVNNEQMLCPY